MTQPVDETRLGELMLSIGKLSSEELLACMESQQQLGGPSAKLLGEILVERGHITVQELQAAMSRVRQMGGLPQTDCAKLLAVAAGMTPHPDDVRKAMADPKRWIGRYVVLSQLGRGGMGIVCHGYDTQLQREVAIKMIATDTATKWAGARFLREARACAKLRHPSIVAVHEAGEQDGQPYMVMELVKGESLTDAIASKKLSLRDLVSIAVDIAKALHHAHEAGVIHRDVKPGNILLSQEGRPLLLDFGVAHETSAQQHLTKTGELLGTPLFMAPEQINGSAVGPWTDVYALGVVLYYGLTGEPPFESDVPVSLFRAILMEEPSPPRTLNPAISHDLETIILKCLQKSHRDRYPTAAAMAEDLQRYLSDQAIHARPIGSGERFRRWIRKNRELSAALLVITLMILGGAATAVYMARRHKSDQILAQRRAGEHEKAALEEAAREREAATLEMLRSEVTAVLNRVISTDTLTDPIKRDIARAQILKHSKPETARLLSQELDAISQILQEHQELSRHEESLLTFLCEAMLALGIQEHAVAGLGRYLNTELSLTGENRNQLRPVAVGKALCFLGGEEADQLLISARNGFGINEAFWRQVRRFYKRTGGQQYLEAQPTTSKWTRGATDSPKVDLDGTIKDLNLAIESDPSNVAALTRRGVIRDERGDYEGSIADFTRAIELDPSCEPAWSNRGVSRAQRGDFAGAIDDYIHCIEINSNNATVWLNLGIARNALSDSNGAIADFTRAIELDPQLASAWYSRGKARSMKEDRDGATGDYTRAIELDANLADAWTGRGIERAVAGDTDGAIADCTRALQINPNLAEAWSYRGYALQIKGDLDAAIADHFRAIALDPSSAIYWNNRGITRRAQGDLDGAIADYTRALEIEPTKALTWFNRGNTRKAKGNLDGAIADYSSALEIDPNLVSCWLNRGIARKAKGDLDGAMVDYNRALELDPREADAFERRGAVRSALGDPAGAITDYTRSLEINPGAPVAWFNRGNSRMTLGDIDGALADYSRAVEIKPDVAGFWTNRGLARLRKGDLDGAIADFTRTIEIEPQLSVGWANRGALRRQKGDLDGAIADFQRFLDLAPNDPRAPAIREQNRLDRAQQAKARNGSNQ